MPQSVLSPNHNTHCPFNQNLVLCSYWLQKTLNIQDVGMMPMAAAAAPVAQVTSHFNI